MTAVPMMIPIPSARNTATIDTRWYRKLITVSPIELEGVPEVVEEQARRLADGGDDEQREHRGCHEEDHVELADPSLVEAVHTLGVDEDVSYLHADEERRCHSGASLLEELRHRVVGADGNDERRATFVGEQHRDVLRRT